MARRIEQGPAMPGLQRLNIIARLSLGFGIVTALILGNSLFGMHSIGKLGDLTAGLYEHPLRVTSALLTARAEFRTIQRDILDVLLASEPAEVDTLAEGINAGDGRMMDALRTARGAFLGDK